MDSVSLVTLAFAGDWETVEARLNADPGLESLNELFESNSDYHTKYVRQLEQMQHAIFNPL